MSFSIYYGGNTEEKGSYYKLSIDICSEGGLSHPFLEQHYNVIFAIGFFILVAYDRSENGPIGVEIASWCLAIDDCAYGVHRLSPDNYTQQVRGRFSPC